MFPFNTHNNKTPVTSYIEIYKKSMKQVVDLADQGNNRWTFTGSS